MEKDLKLIISKAKKVLDNYFEKEDVCDNVIFEDMHNLKKCIDEIEKPRQDIIPTKDNTVACFLWPSEFSKKVFSQDNPPHILKSKYPLNESDMIEEIWLEKGITGTFKNNAYNRWFNYIKYNGELITNKEQIITILSTNNS